MSEGKANAEEGKNGEKSIGSAVLKKGLQASMSFTRDVEEGRKELERAEEDKQRRRSSVKTTATEKEEKKRRRAHEKEERNREKVKEKVKEKEKHKKEKEKESIDKCTGENWAWKVEESLTPKKSSESTKHSVDLESGHYHLLLTKCDPITGVSKRLRSIMTVTAIPSPHTAEPPPVPYHERYEVDFGGLGHSKKQRVDLVVPDHVPHARLDIAVQNAPGAHELLAGKYSVYLSERDKPCLQAVKKKRKSKPVVNFISGFLSPSHSDPKPKPDMEASHSSGAAPAPGKDIFKLQNVLLQGKESWKFTLSSGYYYIGVKHGPSSAGTIQACMKLTNELGIIIRQAGSLEMPKGSEPWRQYFYVADRHSPATLCLKVNATVMGVKTSIKLKELPSPYSLQELRRKTVTLRMYASAGLALVIVASYLFDIVMSIFHATIPFIGMSVRFLLVLIFIPFCIVNQRDLKEFLAGKWEELSRLLAWLKKLESTDTNALQKVALLRERQMQRKKQKKLQREKQHEL